MQAIGLVVLLRGAEERRFVSRGGRRRVKRTERLAAGRRRYGHTAHHAEIDIILGFEFITVGKRLFEIKRIAVHRDNPTAINA
ncbi:hypothetical protein D3C71_1923080 [compost metagenome]